jgi:class 3 adenylate cyclase
MDERRCRHAATMRVPDNRHVTMREPSPTIRSKNLDEPDGMRPIGRGSGGYVDLGRGLTIGRAVLEPGWRWSVDVRPIAGTRSCMVHHMQLVLSGRLGAQMDGGDEQVFGPSSVIDLPPGHDAWVVGDEPAVIVDMSGNSIDFGLPASQSRSVQTMLMTDIVSSTQTAASLGDAAWKQRLAEHNRIVRRNLERFGGREVDTTGDGFLASFASAEAALRCGLAIRDAVAAAGVEIRAGVHTGEVDVVEGGDLRGIAVHETARIMAAAAPGSVYASGLSRALAGASTLSFTSTGAHSLKGFDVPVELFRVDGSS